MDEATRRDMERLVRWALEEDVGSGDITTVSTVPPTVQARAVMVAREPLVVAGLEVVERVFALVSGAVRVERVAQDGAQLQRGDVLVRLVGSAAGILTAERVALNFAQRLSGVATITRRYVEAVRGTKAVILDTRKTTPGLRRLEKMAVVCGGGKNHRVGLFDAVLIKDNHLAALAGVEARPIEAAVGRARLAFPGRTVEVEADTVEQAAAAAAAVADIVLLDNMSLEQLREAVRRVGGRAKTEASGGVNLDTVRAIAETGVDFISVGALTHSARAVDIALDFETTVK